jgi:hypothetical protein
MKIKEIFCLSILALLSVYESRGMEGAHVHSSTRAETEEYLTPGKIVPKYLEYIKIIADLSSPEKAHLTSFLKETVPDLENYEGHNTAALKTLNLQRENQIILKDISDKEQTGPKGHTEQKLLNTLSDKLREIQLYKPLIIALYTSSSPCLNRPNILGGDDPCMKVLQEKSKEAILEKIIVVYSSLYEDPHSDKETLQKNAKILEKIKESIEKSLQVSLKEGEKLQARFRIGLTQLKNSSAEANKKAQVVSKKLDATVKNLDKLLKELKSTSRISELPQGYVGDAFNSVYTYNLPKLHLIYSPDIDNYNGYNPKIAPSIQKDFLEALRETGEFHEGVEECKVGGAGYNPDVFGSFFEKKPQPLMILSEAKNILDFIVQH